MYMYWFVLDCGLKYLCVYNWLSYTMEARKGFLYSLWKSEETCYN